MKTILTAVTNTMIIIVLRFVFAGDEVEVIEGKEETEDDGDGDNKVDVGPVAIVTRGMHYKLRPL